jgi:hypothetical protein
MTLLNTIGYEICTGTDQFKHLKFEKLNNQHVVTLIDSTGYEIVRGYGDNAIEAINDLHSTLI